ncbi:hypothetical protein BDV95DRAFT_494254 [Massariosphaeria phaeospora]|uniref:Uncharacterized protein n=1 Tax=Massariosphaeria phaeospora TaxID=100035 RepID=A0A7C8I5P9_9PLEO|nr:hypothetical protein BDV95DRAFT_494254 [Massariosphaeria phaeospora]
MPRQTTSPIPPLTWDCPNFAQLREEYWNHNYRRPADQYYVPFEQYKYSYFLGKHGYLDDQSSPEAGALLDNEIHPIFEFSNWVGPKNLYEFFGSVEPALRLATLWLEIPTFLKWWVDLYHGRPAFDEKGRVFIRCDDDELPENAFEMVVDELRKLAGKITFSFLSKDQMDGAEGVCFSDLRPMVHKMQDSLQDRTFWYNSWDNTNEPTIALKVSYIDDMIETTHTSAQFILQRHFRFATLILHELSHVCTSLWQPETSKWQEPIVQKDDLLPESGLSWERYIFGARVLFQETTGVMYCTEFDHVYPTDTSRSLLLYTIVSIEWIHQWFLKDTWLHIPEVREQLYAPSIRRQKALFSIQRIFDGVPHEVLYFQGKEVKTDEVLWNLRRGEYFQSTEYADYIQPTNGSGWPTAALDIIALYKQIWSLDIALFPDGKSMPDWLGKPHYYWDKAKLCCPYSQLDLDSELIPPPTTQSDLYYASATSACKHCRAYQSRDRDYIPAVPYSRRQKSAPRLIRVVPRRLVFAQVSYTFPRRRARYVRPVGRYWYCPIKLLDTPFEQIGTEMYRVVEKKVDKQD